MARAAAHVWGVSVAPRCRSALRDSRDHVLDDGLDLAALDLVPERGAYLPELSAVRRRGGLHEAEVDFQLAEVTFDLAQLVLDSFEPARVSRTKSRVSGETQYFADPFEAPAWRAKWREL